MSEPIIVSYEQWMSDRSILLERIFPLVSTDELRKRISYCFKIDHCYFYIGWMPIWAHYETHKKEVKAELERIKKEYNIETKWKIRDE